MKVLVVHNRYRSALPSGENRIVDADIAALRGAGLEVEAYLRSSDEIGEMGLVEKAHAAAAPLGASPALDEIRALIRRFRPDVLHLHNPYPLVSPSVIDVAVAEGVPVVHTVHNYRQVCARGTFYRDGGVCEDCRDRRFPWPAVAHGCYRGSRLQSLVMASALALHEHRWRRVARFVAVSDFVADHLVRWGISRDRIRVKPNPVPDPGPPGPPGSGFLYLGRLDPEKGIGLLLDAWERAGSDWPLTIAGVGPLRDRVERAEGSSPSIHYLGQVPAARAHELLRETGVVVVPSTWYEGFPTTVIEALAHGRPVAASDLGSLARIVTPDFGWRVPPEVEAWARALRAIPGEELGARGRKARERYEEGGFSRTAEPLLAIYRELVA